MVTKKHCAEPAQSLFGCVHQFALVPRYFGMSWSGGVGGAFLDTKRS